MRTVEILEDIQEEAFVSAWNDFNLYQYIWPELQDHIIWESEDKQIVAVYQNGEPVFFAVEVLDFLGMKLPENKVAPAYIPQQSWNDYIKTYFKRCEGYLNKDRTQKNIQKIISKQQEGSFKQSDWINYGESSYRSELAKLLFRTNMDWDTIVYDVIGINKIADAIWDSINREAENENSYCTFSPRNNPNKKYVCIYSFVTGEDRKGVYYFDENKVFQRIDYDDIPKRKFQHVNGLMDSCMFFSLYAKNHLKVGDSFDSYIEGTLHSSKMTVVSYYTKERHIITKISRPSFERDIDNPSNKGFDWIRIEESLNSSLYSLKEYHQYIKKNKKDFDKPAIAAIKESKKFQSLGIPINCLRLSNLVLRKDFILEYTFEIKEINTDAQKPAI